MSTAANSSTATTSWEQLRQESLAAMTEAERAKYDAAAREADARLELAELVYRTRTEARISQTELARRARTRTSVIVAIENGANTPKQSTLDRILQSLDQSHRGSNGHQKKPRLNRRIIKSTPKGSHFGTIKPRTRTTFTGSQGEQYVTKEELGKLIRKRITTSTPIKIRRKVQR